MRWIWLRCGRAGISAPYSIWHCNDWTTMTFVFGYCRLKLRWPRRLGFWPLNFVRHAIGYFRTVSPVTVIHICAYMVIAKFHYTDPTGPARTQRSFAAKKVRASPCGSGRVRVRVRVVEFSSYSTTCADFVRVRSVSGPCSGIKL